MKRGIKITFNTKEEREKTIIENIDLVHSISARYAEQTGIPVEEIESYGYEGLILGIDKYNPENKSTLRLSLYNPIKHTIEKYITFVNNYHAFAPDSLNQHKEDLVYTETNVTHYIEHEEWTIFFKQYIARVLSERQQRIINLYYGLNDSVGKNTSEIAELEDVSRSRIEQIYHDALRILRYNRGKNKKYFEEIDHDIDAEVGYVKKKKRK